MWKAGLLALALVAAAGEARAQPPVWVVRDKDSELVLFGSVHVLPPGLDWSPPALDRAIGRAADLWFELPIDPATELQSAQLATQKGLLPQGKSLSALLSKDGAARLARVAQAHALPLGQVDRMEPWLAEVMLGAAAYRKAGASAGAGVERTLAASAPASAARRAFETPGEQIALLDQAPLAEQVASLETTLVELEERPELYRDLVAAWMSGDLAALDRLAIQPMRKAAPGLFRRLVTERNRAWTAVLRKRLQGSGRTVVVVGVGHLIGADGLPARLRALGYSVEGP